MVIFGLSFILKKFIIFSWVWSAVDAIVIAAKGIDKKYLGLNILSKGSFQLMHLGD